MASVLAKQGETLQALGEYRTARDILARLKEQLPDDVALTKDVT